jgi:hypothetical protein
MPCWHIDEESHSPYGVNIHIFLLLEDEIIFKVSHNVTQPLPELQSSQPLVEKK